MNVFLRTDRACAFVVALILIASTATVCAETWDWTFAGAPLGDPNVGGIQIDPDYPSIWYVMSWNGIYVTRNAGTGWQNYLSGYCGALEIDPTNHARVYASSDLNLYRSDNRGYSWSLKRTFPGYIESILVSETDGSIYVGIKWVGAPSANGIYKSVDAGSTWNLYAFGSPDSNLIIWDIEEDPANNKLYVCTEISNHPTPYHPPIFRSSDGGFTWEEISGTIPWHALKIQVHPLTHAVYLLTESLGLYRSTDFGDTWIFLNNNFVLDFLIDRNHPNRFYGGNTTWGSWDGGVFRSTDTGQSFELIGLSGIDAGGLCFNAASTKLYAACHGIGIYVGAKRAGPRTWYVYPDGAGDAPTIQAAIDSAAASDSLLLANGTFRGVGNRGINYRGKAITVRGRSGIRETCIINCEDADRGFYIGGGGAGTRLEAVTVMRGRASYGSGYSHLGGGLFCENSTDGPLITDCTFFLNHAEGHGGGAHGGFSGTPTFTNCAFKGNTTDASGGAFICGWGAAGVCSPTFTNCVFIRNTSAAYGGAVHGGKVDDGSAEFSNCTFVGNMAATGGAISSFFHDALVSQCTFSGNIAPAGGGLYCDNSSPTIENSIIAFSADGSAIYCSGSSAPQLTCCDIYGNVDGDWTGCIADQAHTNGNCSTNPYFCDPMADSYSLAALSYCLPEHNSCGVLMGAQGYGCDQPTGIEAGEIPMRRLQLTSNYPNPFNPSTTILFSIDERCHVSLRIYNIRGRLVASLRDSDMPPGDHAALWDGRDASGAEVGSGVYLVRLDAAGRLQSRKMILLR